MPLMKHTKKPIQLFGKSLLTTAALLACATQARAQSADVLIDKLVEKGILSVREAQDLREEADKNFTAAVQSKLGMPDWVSGYKISGDVRARYDHISSENEGFAARERYRYRLRFGITVNMFDNLEAGFRLASGDAKGSAGNPLSANSTMQDNFSKKSIYIDTAYGKWTPVNSGGWQLSTTVGKMENPFTFTPRVFDPDLTPEGAAVQANWAINDQHSVSFTGAGFVLDEEQSLASDPAMVGAQVVWTGKWNEKFSTTLGAGTFKITSTEQLTSANVPYVNQGNTRYITQAPVTGADLYSLKYGYFPAILNGSATYTLDSFPFYNGAFPIKASAEFMQNLATSANNQGFWIGVTLGKSGTKKTWDLTYRYERLESDAWYDQLVDDDNGAFYPGDQQTGTAGSIPFGYYGGTNVKGHMVKFNYSFTDSFTFTATCFINDLISADSLVANGLVPDNKTSAAFHFMADVMWKF